MPLIVDTYNVLHVVGVLPPDLAGIETRDLIDLLQRSRYRRERVVLVCDGVPGPGAARGRFGSISVEYAGDKATADDRIAAIIRQSSAPRRLAIVSSDRAIVREARRRRCPTIDSAEFLRHLAHDHATSSPAAPAPPAPPRSAGAAGLPPALLDEAEALWRAGEEDPPKP